MIFNLFIDLFSCTYFPFFLFQLQKHDKDLSSSKLRTEEEMAEEAAVLRKYFTESNK